MRILLLILLLHSPLFAVLPETVGFELAARSPNIGEVTDYLFGLDVEYPILDVHFEYEQENGEYFTNYQVDGAKKSGHWVYELSTRESQARDVNTQKIACKRKLFGFGIGIGLTAEDYDTGKLQGVSVYSVPLYRYGSVGYMTNYGGYEVWDIDIEIAEENHKVSGRFYREIGKPVDWAVSFDLKINFTE